METEIKTLWFASCTELFEMAVTLDVLPSRVMYRHGWWVGIFSMPVRGNA